MVSSWQGLCGEDALAETRQVPGRYRDDGMVPLAAYPPGLGGQTGLGGGPHQVVVPGLDKVVVDVHGWFPFGWSVRRRWTAVPAGAVAGEVSCAGPAGWSGLHQTGSPTRPLAGQRADYPFPLAGALWVKRPADAAGPMIPAVPSGEAGLQGQAGQVGAAAGAGLVPDPVQVNRPGFCGGSQSTGEWEDGSSTEVSGRAA